MAGRGAIVRLAPLLLGGLLAACATTAPRAISGTLPPPGSYSIVAADTFAPDTQAALARALSARGLIPVADGQRPDRLVRMTLADRPLPSGSFAGEKPPASHRADGWLDRPQRRRFLQPSRREIRLTLRFLSHDGVLREQRTAIEIVRRDTPVPNVPELIEAALKP